MLYKIDENDKSNFVKLIYGFICLDEKLDDKKKKNIFINLKDILDIRDNNIIQLSSQDDLLKAYGTINNTKLRKITKEILLDLNNTVHHEWMIKTKTNEWKKYIDELKI